MGDTTISTANGGATKLALISVGDLTSGNIFLRPAGANTLRFTGVDTVLLATQAGSIFLDGLEFQDIGQLYFYARGATSDLILGSSLVDIGLVILQAENDVQVNAAVDHADGFFVYAGRDFLNGTGNVRADGSTFARGMTSTSSSASSPPAAPGIPSSSWPAIRSTSMPEGASGFTRADSIFASGNTINVFAIENQDIVFFSDPTVTFQAGAGGFIAPLISFDHLAAGNPFDITSAGEISLRGIIGVDNMTAGTSFSASELVITQTLDAGTFIATGDDLTALSFINAGSTIDVAGTLSSPLVIAGGDVTAQTVRVLTLQAPTGILTAGSGGIVPFVTVIGAAEQHTFFVDSIVSSNGISFGGDQFFGTNDDLSGGRLTIFANNLRWDAAFGIGATNFNGVDHFLTVPNLQGGSGGVLVANAVGDIFVGEMISATTGLNNRGNPMAAFGGAGGKVTLNAGGNLTVESTILVSSNDFAHNVGSSRNSASGGDITLHSDLANGNAITLNGNSRLLSYLDDAAPGPGGTVQVTSAGGDIVAEGEIVADRGTIIISNGASLDGRPAAPEIGSMISLGGPLALLRAETLLVSSGGDLNIGLLNGVYFDAITVTLSAQNNINGGLIDLYNDGLTEDVMNSSGNVKILAGGSILLDRLEVSRRNAGRTSGLNISVEAGSDLSIASGLYLSTDASNLATGGNIFVLAGGDMTLDDFATLEVRMDGDADSGANITLDAARTIAAGALTASIQIDDAALNAGGNIALAAGGDATFNGSNGRLGLFLGIFLQPGASIATGGDIQATIGGNLAADQINARISGLGAIADGAAIDFNITGNLTTFFGDATFIIDGAQSLFGRPDGIAPSPSASIFVQAANITIGNSDFAQNLTAYIDDSSFGGLPSGGGGSVLIESFDTINLFGTLNVLGTVNAGGDIVAGTVASTDVISSTRIAAGQGGITRFGLLDFARPIELPHADRTDHCLGGRD